ncbi:hypothetical protein HID58_013923 [Brassica napus]|uniref:Pentatricopeptide repeat-containing protein n=1 Tax=Brassica napus TaxID=3708 RepID=A0ABQ8DFS9_BRANA|nr:hypothetical protein HID58_013923 [Brassica napus]
MEEEMEEKGIEADSVTFHSMFIGMMKCREFGFDRVCELYCKMKLFCQKGEVNLGLDLWRYMVEKGYCPRGHVLDLLTTALCARRRAVCVSALVFRMLEISLSSNGELEKLEELKRKTQKLHSFLPPPGTQLI